MDIVTVKNKYQVVIPQRVRDQISVAIGDIFEATVEGGKITLTPKSIIDRAIAEGLRDVQAGRVYSHFKTAQDMKLSVEKNIKKSHRKFE